VTRDCATARYHFTSGTGLAIEAAFDGGRLTSDGGLPWLEVADRDLGLCAALAAVIPEWRQRHRANRVGQVDRLQLAAVIPEWRQRHLQHSLETLVRQRVFQIACGYADQNDAATLRQDPLLKLVCGRRPDGDPDLASQPTLSRLEHALDWRSWVRLALALVAVYLAERERAGRPTRIVLDMDGTDDPTHGEHEGSR